MTIGAVLMHNRFEGALLDHFQKFLLELGRGFSFGRRQQGKSGRPRPSGYCCAEKNDALVRYTLPERERQIFASRYQLYLPSEDELAAKLNRERKILALK